MIAPWILVLLVGAALGLIAIALNQVHARLGLVELTLNDGWPPGHAPTDVADPTIASIDPQQALTPGLHLFLSRSCHGCQRLVDELAAGSMPTHVPSFHYIDRARPASRALATSWNTAVLDNQRELANGLGADPLPYAIAIGPHGLVARSVTPTSSLLDAVANNAGLHENGSPTGAPS